MINNLNIKDFQIPVSVTPNPFNNYFKIHGVENDAFGSLLQDGFQMFFQPGRLNVDGQRVKREIGIQK